MNAVSTLGIDLAKNTFSVHGVDVDGVVTVRRTVSRGKLAELVARAACAIEAAEKAIAAGAAEATGPAVEARAETTITTG